MGQKNLAVLLGRVKLHELRAVICQTYCRVCTLLLHLLNNSTVFLNKQPEFSQYRIQ